MVELFECHTALLNRFSASRGLYLGKTKIIMTEIQRKSVLQLTKGLVKNIQ